MMLQVQTSGPAVQTHPHTSSNWGSPMRRSSPSHPVFLVAWCMRDFPAVLAFPVPGDCGLVATLHPLGPGALGCITRYSQIIEEVRDSGVGISFWAYPLC